MMTHLALLMAGVSLLLCAAAQAGAQSVPRPEHPRPDFQRDTWLNLNGTWQFEVDAKGDGEERGLTSGHDLAAHIIVPFCPESRLSGIGHRDFMEHVWYRRMFRVPGLMKGKRLLLRFGAVDWHARVWLNGRFLGEHRGGYSPFTFEITRFIKPGDNELVLHVRDETRSKLQATGKQAQSQESEGCVYTRTTGIWQTVWLEAVGENSLREFTLTPDPESGRLLFRGWVDGPSKGVKVRLRAYAKGKLVGEETVPAAWRTTLGVVRLNKVTLWQPGRAFLYDLTIEVLRNGKATDTVRSYFGLRALAIEGNRFLINGKPIFQRLILDQGFYPDGIYTAPSDADLRRDVELSMAAGFNGARLHQKVFEPRLLYWADRLGYLVWGEYPSWGLDWSRQEALAYAAAEWREVLERDRNHPSIIGWCPLNETGGGEAMAAAQAIFTITQTADPTRPYLDTSGYVHLDPATDVYDCHDYDQNPTSFEGRYADFRMTGSRPFNNNPGDPRSAYRGQPYFVSEYGGIRLKTDRDVGVKGWGYGETSLQEFLARYKGLTDALLDNPNMFGFCYTQLTDVEQEQNGVFFYDRKPKYDPALLRKINARPAAYETQPPRIMQVEWTPLVPTSQRAPQTWRYTTERPADNWFRTGFDDSGWQQGEGGFGTEGTPGAVVGTTWNTSDIWIRRTFRLESKTFDLAALTIHHDEEAEVYVNGRQIAAFAGFVGAYFDREATDALKKAVVVGVNVLAVHCHQTVGGQFIDAGISVAKKGKQ
jgi:hypothetical protein